jgi:mycothiol system anti-sigma-R factor
MNCDECLHRLDELVDRELSEAELAEASRHLADCAPCDREYRLHVGMKRLVHVYCCRETAPAQLREKLREILF